MCLYIQAKNKRDENTEPTYKKKEESINLVSKKRCIYLISKWFCVVIIYNFNFIFSIFHYFA
jgi:hypothetical protein